MAVSEESILKITKEIVVKFIEMGRISPTSFSDSFKEIYTSIKSTVEQSDLLSILTEDRDNEEE